MTETPVPELIERGVPAAVRRQNRGRTLFEAGIFVLLIAALIVAAFALGALSRIETGQQVSFATSVRQDCARTVNAEQGAVKDRENLLFKQMVLAAFDRDLVAYEELRKQYGPALAAEAELVPIDKAVEARCPEVK